MGYHGLVCSRGFRASYSALARQRGCPSSPQPLLMCYLWVGCLGPECCSRTHLSCQSIGCQSHTNRHPLDHNCHFFSLRLPQKPSFPRKGQCGAGRSLQPLLGPGASCRHLCQGIILIVPRLAWDNWRNSTADAANELPYYCPRVI